MFVHFVKTSNRIFTFFSQLHSQTILSCQYSDEDPLSKMIALLLTLSAVAERPRDALCPSVVSFNSVILPVQSFIMVTYASDLRLRTIKFCSVVFGVTLTLFVINTSSSGSRHQQTPPLTAATSVINVPWSIACKYITLGGRSTR